VADVGFFEEAVAFAARHGLLLCHDAAYAEMTYDGFVAPSALQVEGALETTIEFGSLSKTYNMTGWRVGWAAGNAEAIRALAAMKTNLDSGVFDAVQRAGVAALVGPQESVDAMRAVYQKRRDVVVAALRDVGVDVSPPLGSIYVWAPTPSGRSSASFTEDCLDQAGVLVSPGTGYGEHGEGFFRISLTVGDDRLAEAMQRLRARMG
jgi:LL-diaminopimelate aminotransferase